MVQYLVQKTHCGWCWGNYVINKEEQGLFSSEVNPLANKEVELSDWDVVESGLFQAQHTVYEASQSDLKKQVSNDIKMSVL